MVCHMVLSVREKYETEEEEVRFGSVGAILIR